MLSCFHSVCCSDKGYTDNVLGIAWIKHFDSQMTERAQGHYHCLFVDGHESHCSIEFLHYAINNKIIIISYPPHCMHALQGLDVTCFG
jgi:hypothetical protein